MCTLSSSRFTCRSRGCAIVNLTGYVYQICTRRYGGLYEILTAMCCSSTCPEKDFHVHEQEGEKVFRRAAYTDWWLERHAPVRNPTKGIWSCRSITLPRSSGWYICNKTRLVRVPAGHLDDTTLLTRARANQRSMQASSGGSVGCFVCGSITISHIPITFVTHELTIKQSAHHPPTQQLHNVTHTHKKRGFMSE